MHDPQRILDIASYQYGTQLYWHIRRLVVSHDDAEDALQETFIKIFTKASSFRGGDENLKAWFYQIATREALMCLRRRTHAFQSLDSLCVELSERVAAESASDADSGAVLFQQAILQLSTQQRIVFNLRYYDELPYDQIAVGIFLFKPKAGPEETLYRSPMDSFLASISDTEASQIVDFPIDDIPEYYR